MCWELLHTHLIHFTFSFFSSCLNGGTCIDGVNTYTCKCPLGYSGSNCQTAIKPCDSNPCHNAATCVDRNATYQCFCPYGFSGPQCSDFIDWCSNNPCKNGGSCHQTANEFRCNCTENWTGVTCDILRTTCEIAAKTKGLRLFKMHSKFEIFEFVFELT